MQPNSSIGSIASVRSELDLSFIAAAWICRSRPGRDPMPTSGVAINLRRHPHASLDDGVCATCSNVGRPPASAIPEPLPAAAQLSRVEGHRLAVERIEQPVVRIERAVPRNSTKAKAQQRREPEHRSLYPGRPLHDQVPQPWQVQQTARVTCSSSSDFQGNGARHAWSL